MTVDFFDLSTNAPTSWQWTFFGANPSSSNVKDPAGIVYSTPGSYSVRLEVSNSVGAAQEVKQGYIQVGTVDSENPNSEFYKFTVWPNPSNGTFSILGSLPRDLGGCSLVLLDSKGKVVRRRGAKIVGGNLDVQFVTELSSGVYFLSIQVENRKFTRKLIIQN